MARVRLGGAGIVHEEGRASRTHTAVKKGEGCDRYRPLTQVRDTRWFENVGTWLVVFKA